MLKDDTKAARDDKNLIDLMLRQKPLSAYRAYWACADIKRAGSGVLVKKSIPVVSAKRSIMSPNEDHAEGRVLLLEFANMVVLNTYAQNNGWNAASMTKRRQWDGEVKAFLLDQSLVRRPRVPVQAPPGGDDCRLKPIVWTGDLNVCHRVELDVSHPKFFLSQKPEGKKGKAPEDPPSDPKDQGQPGSTENERLRFDDIIRASRLTDAYRHLHGDARSFTWYGHPGVNAVGKYRGKGMRLDYFWLSGGLHERIEECAQAADGLTDAEVLHRPTKIFFGSDHCAVYLKLRPVGGPETEGGERNAREVTGGGGGSKGEGGVEKLVTAATNVDKDSCDECNNRENTS